MRGRRPGPSHVLEKDPHDDEQQLVDWYREFVLDKVLDTVTPHRAAIEGYFVRHLHLYHSTL